MNYNIYIIRGILADLTDDLDIKGNILVYREKDYNVPVKAVLSTEFCTIDFQWLPNSKLLLISSIEVADNGCILFVIQTKNLITKTFHWAKINAIRLIEADGVKVI